MNTPCRRLDDVALREVFKSVDAATLHKCRQVSSVWNREIQRLSKYTRKFEPNSLIMELIGCRFRLSVAALRRCEPFEESDVHSSVVRRALKHVSPPQTLNMFLEKNVGEEAFEQVMDGMDDDWCSRVGELEIVTYSDVPLSRILSRLEKFPNIVRLSLSHYCNERISCADVFRRLPELRYLRIYGLNGNDGSDTSSGLVFDETAIEALLVNQNGVRKLQRIEFYNTDVCVSMEAMTTALRRLARLPMHAEILERPLLLEDKEEATTVHLLFGLCRWDTIKEVNLLTSIIRMSSEFNFPIRQSEEEDVLKGDFRFRVFDTNFILKFMT